VQPAGEGPSPVGLYGSSGESVANGWLWRTSVRGGSEDGNRGGPAIRWSKSVIGLRKY
jgi:hypothetical protein